jgi:hypothetical protein
MDPMTYLAAQLLVVERLRARPAPPRLPTRVAATGGARRALAAAFVRLGLRLDPAAGEGLGALQASTGRPA